MLTRRGVMAGILTGAVCSGGPGAAQSLTRSLIPRPNPRYPRNLPPLEAVVAHAGLSGEIGFVVQDANSGEVLEAWQPTQPLPPASTAKALTASYALRTLGAGHRFTTRVLALGSLNGGRLHGDLVLVGGGDPELDTRALGDLAAQVKASGLFEVTGRLLYYDGALPSVGEIDPDQPDHVGYNPSLSGLNLNFNRVHFEWKRAGAGWSVTMDARAGEYRPEVGIARMQVIDRSAPVYTYSSKGSLDQWTVASGALGGGGSRWLPVRNPGLYSAEVFGTLMRAHGVAMPAPARLDSRPNGRELARVDSRALTDILRDMLKYSTNLTAEIVGLSASQARGLAPDGLAASAQAMAGWAWAELGTQAMHLEDHSGLGPGSRLSPADMTAALRSMGAGGALHRLMKPIVLRDAEGKLLENHPAQVFAKTGTLNFVSALAGYLTTPAGRDLAFTIFTADAEARARIHPDQRERPPGGRSWTAKSRRLQYALLDRWSILGDRTGGPDAQL